MQKHMRRLSRKSLRLSAVCRNFGGINNGGTKCAASLQLIKHSFDVCSTIGFKHGDSKSWEMLRACLNKGLRSSPIMLNAGRGDLLGAEPGVDMAPTLSSPWGRITTCVQCSPLQNNLAEREPASASKYAKFLL